MQGRDQPLLQPRQRRGVLEPQRTFNFGKRGTASVTLDLTRERASSCSASSRRRADVFIENNSAAVVGDSKHRLRRAVGRSTLRLIMVRFPGFGITGPYSAASGLRHAMEAVVGHTLVRGYADAGLHRDAADLPRRPQRRRARGLRGAGRAVRARAHRRGAARRPLAGRGGIDHLSYALMDCVHERPRARAPGQPPPVDGAATASTRAGDDGWTCLALAADSDEAFARSARMGQPGARGRRAFRGRRLAPPQPARPRPPIVAVDDHGDTHRD